MHAFALALFQLQVARIPSFRKVNGPCLLLLGLLTGKCLMSFISLLPKAEARVESVDVMF